jgi:tetratricopeptide (TPR) repeat protein
MEFSLRSRGRAALFLVAVGLPLIALGVETLRVAIAATLGESQDVSKLRWALALDPRNPDLYHRLGLIRAYGSDALAFAQGLHDLRRATELNPRVALYWLDLGAACESAGDVACADAAFTHALELSPMTPRVRWAVANHNLRAGRTEAALRGLRGLVALSPEYALPSFHLAVQLLNDPQAVFDKVLGSANMEPKLAYVNFLSANGEADAAYAVWLQTVAQVPSVNWALAEPYLERLLDQGRTQEALSVWQAVAKSGGLFPARDDAENVVFNGGFEQAPLNAGFDWRYRIAPGVGVDFSDPSARQGLRCLRLDFTVSSNEEYEPVYQLVPVRPNQEYVLTASARSQNITSNSGPRLRVLDPHCPRCLDVATDTTVGTTPWHTLSISFSTGAETRFLRLVVWRPRSRTFPTEITGQFWLDAVSLKPQPTESAQRQ